MTRVQMVSHHSSLGALTWIAVVAGLRPNLPEAMLLLASLVAVPLGVSLVVREESTLRRAVSGLHWPAAVCLAWAFAQRASPVAAALAVPWLMLTIMIAALGIRRLIDHHETASDVSLGCGLVYLAVGGAWALLSRAGLRPLGFPDVIVLLTAVHFHYAGFCLPILAGRVGHAVAGPLARLACLGAIAGVPFVAAGITLSQLGPGLSLCRFVEFLASLLLATAVAAAGLLQVRLAVRTEGPLMPRAGLALSGVAAVGPAVLATLYALGNFRQVYWLDIAAMVRFHGVAMALGFALPGLVSWQGLPHDPVPEAKSNVAGKARTVL